MISNSDLMSMLVAGLGEKLETHGFVWVKKFDDFVREQPRREERIGLDLYKWPGDDVSHVTFRLKVWFSELQEALSRLDPGRSSKPDKGVCSVNRLIDNLYPKDIDHFDWPILDGSDVEAALPEMFERLKEFGFAFFAALPDLESLSDVLKEPGGEWPTPTAELRAQLLLLCLGARGEKDEFRRWRDDLEQQVASLRGGYFSDRFRVFAKAAEKEYFASA